MRSLALRIGAGITAVGWGLGAAALIVDDATLWRALAALGGGGPIPHHPALAYWQRMLGCCCVLICVLGMIVTLLPQRARMLAWLLAGFQIFTAAVLFAWGIGLDLPHAVWGIDVWFCGLSGLLMLAALCWRTPTAP